MEECVDEIREWMKSNYLKLNDNKTEFILFGSPVKLGKINVPHFRVGDSDIPPVDQVCNLGVLMDNKMSMESHINATIKSCSYHIRNLGKIRKYLNQQATEQLVHAFISSRLDMGNALLYGLPNNLIRRLQLKQNTAARLVTGTKVSMHISPILSDLHWLPVRFRIQFKILLLTYRAINNLAPPYITELLVLSQTRSGLRSASQHLLAEPKTLRSWGDRSFFAAAPHLWNNLPEHIRFSATLQTFKSRLKTHLMDIAFS